jgi:hypothetical protein
VTGASRGAIISSYLAEWIPEIRAAFVVAGGGNLPEIFAYTDLKELTDLKRVRQEEFSLPRDDKAYYQFMRQHVHHDPQFVRAGLANSHFITLKQDKTVPFHTQLLLAQVWGAHTVEVFPRLNHYWGIVYHFYWNGARIVDYFANLFVNTKQ